MEKPPAYDLLQFVQPEKASSEENEQRETFILFSGPKGSGKTTLIQKWLDNRQDVPPSTVGLEYSYCRKAKGLSNIKDIAHIWDLSSESMNGWIEVPITDSSIQNSLVVVCVDLSKPSESFSPSLSALTEVHGFINEKLESLEKRGSKRPKALRNNALKRHWSGHPEAQQVRISPIEILLIGNKYDLLEQMPTDKRRIVTRSFRWLAHSFGASLLFISKDHDISIQRLKRFMSNFSFKVPFKPQHLVPSFDDYLYIMAGTSTPYKLTLGLGSDSFSAMSLPNAKISAKEWQEIISKAFSVDMNSKTVDQKIDPDNYKEDEIDRLLDAIKLNKSI